MVIKVTAYDLTLKNCYVLIIINRYSLAVLERTNYNGYYTLLKLYIIYIHDYITLVVLYIRIILVYVPVLEYNDVSWVSVTCIWNNKNLFGLSVLLFFNL